ncbi:MAG: hypothetical protein Q9201_003189 [Fulgogasparrea decipioides]
MPRPRGRESVRADDVPPILEELWADRGVHGRGIHAANAAHPGASQAFDTPGPSPQSQDAATESTSTTRHWVIDLNTHVVALATPEPNTMAAPMGPLSPSHSPRLPSPPPFPESQIGPQSPTANPAQGISTQEPHDATRYDESANRRIRPGSTSAEMDAGPPLVPLNQIDSSFQLQEHLKSLYAKYTRSEDGKTSVPINAETARLLAKHPDNVDPLLWLYELCRHLVNKENYVVVGFFNESPPCSKDTCPEMRASEWQYLCAVHDPPKGCCAIDYCTHTLDWAANQLTSSKIFPSRLTLGSQATGGSQGGLRALTNVMRRCYRIFAHAWYQHRQVFWNIENSMGLYILFKTVCDKYNLIPQDSYTIPPEAEGLSQSEEEPQEVNRSGAKQPEPEPSKPAEPEAATTISTGATTRRHKHTPSTGSAVTTIAESEEDDKEHHSPDKDVPLDLLQSSALKASSTSVLTKKPGTEKGKESEAAKKDVKDMTSGMQDMGMKEKEESSASMESGEESEAETVLHDP